jgi:hypothetical protein
MARGETCGAQGGKESEWKVTNPFSTARKAAESVPIERKLREEIHGMNKSNWRTSLHGIIAGCLMLATIWLPQYHAELIGTAGAFVAMGLISAGDAANLK